MACGRLFMFMEEYEGHWQSTEVGDAPRQSMADLDVVRQTLMAHVRL